MNKRAGLSLGINTIIVLVIAMVVIAAGISFIRTFFTAGEDRLLGAFDIGDFRNQPDRNNPLILEHGTIRGRAGDDAVVRIGFYNRDHDTALNTNISLGGCIGSVTPQGDWKLLASPQNVSGLSSTGFGTILQIPSGAEGRYVCSLSAVNQTRHTLESTQVEVQVTT